jgi:hypothetical protein
MERLSVNDSFSGTKLSELAPASDQLTVLNPLKPKLV